MLCALPEMCTAVHQLSNIFDEYFEDFQVESSMAVLVVFFATHSSSVVG